MNVSPDLMLKLAIAAGAPTDLFADGVVKFALERLQGDKEYHLEVLEESGRWVFHSFHETFAAAQLSRAQLRRDYDSQYRIVEMLRRVLP